MYQSVNGMGSMGRAPREMTMAMGTDGRAGDGSGVWNRQTMDMSGQSGGINNRNNRQSASEIFREKYAPTCSKQTRRCTAGTHISAESSSSSLLIQDLQHVALVLLRDVIAVRNSRDC